MSKRPTAFIGGESVTTDDAIVVLPFDVPAPDWLIRDCSSARRTKTGWVYIIAPEHFS